MRRLCLGESPSVGMGMGRVCIYCGYFGVHVLRLLYERRMLVGAVYTELICSAFGLRHLYSNALSLL